MWHSTVQEAATYWMSPWVCLHSEPLWQCALLIRSLTFHVPDASPASQSQVRLTFPRAALRDDFPATADVAARVGMSRASMGHPQCAATSSETSCGSVLEVPSPVPWIAARGLHSMFHRGAWPSVRRACWTSSAAFDLTARPLLCVCASKQESLQSAAGRPGRFVGFPCKSRTGTTSKLKLSASEVLGIQSFSVPSWTAALSTPCCRRASTSK
mmetsp:Transcript_10665/g.29585  ORF Transcript_10665/g.29585 Transcript_10665/m.29585 type:complete len:213 (-) Transcript_10665:960-1598(-)